MGYLHSEGSTELLEAVSRLEIQADAWFSLLDISKVPWNLATWTSLTSTIEIIERTIHEKGYGSGDHKAAMMNLGRALALLTSEIRQKGSHTETLTFKLSQALYESAAFAIENAHKYNAFTYTFPLWYRGMFRLEIIGPAKLRFVAVGGENDRRVRAFHMGFRPPGYVHPREESPDPVLISVEESQEFERTLDTCQRNGKLGFFYPNPFTLYGSLFKKYLAILLTTFRRDLSISVGSYTLGDFSRFYAALLAVCAVHEHLCHLWSRSHDYPLNAAVLVKERRFWVRLCSRLSNLDGASVDRMIADLSLGATRPLDLHVHPFVPISQDSSLMGVVPHFPLFSKSEENVLRVCSYINSDVYSLTSLSKEAELRDDLCKAAGTQIASYGPIKLPAPVPDIDLLMTDETNSTVLICELKWIRKPSIPLEHMRANQEFTKGLKQLATIQQFLKAEPTYLKNRKLLTADLGQYRNIIYLLIARDHFVWAEPQNDIYILDFAPFKNLLESHQVSPLAIKKLLKYEWLPREGRDFEVRFDYAELNGTTIETEAFYNPNSRNIPIRNSRPVA
jgi:hypothetical protein